MPEEILNREASSTESCVNALGWLSIVIGVMCVLFMKVWAAPMYGTCEKFQCKDFYDFDLTFAVVAAALQLGCYFALFGVLLLAVKKIIEHLREIRNRLDS